MTAEHVHDLIEPYTLGALEADQEVAVRTHLAGCEECAARATRLAVLMTDVASGVASAATNASGTGLPVGLRERVLSAATGTRDPAVRREPGLRWRLVAAAAVIALLLLTGSLVWNRELTHSLAQERQLRTELAGLVGAQETVLEVVDSNVTVKRQLRAATPGTPSYGKLYTRPDLPHVVVMAARLPAAGGDRRYTLWLTLDGQLQLAGELDVNAQGFGLLVFDADRDGPQYEAALLTLQEPGPTPAGETVLAWPAQR